MNQNTNWIFLGLVRFYLAAVVFGTHFAYFSGDRSWWITLSHDLGGKAAVLGFMLISGYSIAASLQARSDGFYLRRFLRIYPLYIVAVMLTMFIEFVTNGIVQAHDRSFESLGWIVGIGNSLLLQTFLVKPMSFNTPLWSLSVEVFFYLCAPLFVRLPARWIFALIIISLACFMLPQREDFGTVYYVLSKFNALRYMWAWLLGFMLWHYKSKAISIFSIVCGSVVFFHEHTTEIFSIATYLIAIISILVSPYISTKTLSLSSWHFLGEISYPLYLFHYPVLIAAYFYGFRNTSILIIFVFGIAIIMYLYIDKFLKSRYLEPWLSIKWKQHFADR